MDDYESILRRNGFRLPRLTADPASGIHYATVGFPTKGGGRGRVNVTASVLGSSDFLSLLKDRDAKLPLSPGDRRSLMVALSEAEPQRREVYAKTAGWSPDEKWFVFGTNIAGEVPKG